MTAEEIYQKVEHIEGWFDLANVEAFLALGLTGELTVFECGTYKGRSTTAMSLMWPQAQIYTCDPHSQPDAIIHRTMFWLDAGRNIPWDREIDILFIDDSHYYDDIKENFDKFSPFVKPGGYVVFHDYHFESAGGVKKFVDELGGCQIDASGEFGLAIWRKDV
jgi:hypothetical protein